MIIHYKNNFNKLNIKYKISQKYSDEYTYQPIFINKKQLLVIQTPSLFVPFGIQEFDGKKRIIISFQNKINDPYNKKFLDDLHILYNKVKDQYHNYNINPFIYLSSYDECMKLKINNNIISFNQYQNKIDIIKPYSYCSFLIHLSGLWILKDDIFFDWKLLQIRYDEPLYYKTYQFIPDSKPISKIPPPPPLPSKLITKKYERKKKVIKNKDKSNFIAPNLNDIQNALSKLKSIQITL
tara:strand:- start:6625 stop:7338 length:714 start_codon:yes stop_codon:yes gene_type:complete